MADELIAIVVDDDFLIRMSAADILTNAGFIAFEAEDADEAVLVLERNAGIRLLFTDVEMPGSMNGFGLARLVAKRWPDIAIAVCSGRMTPGPDDLPAGATFIGKPFSAELVHDHVRKILPHDARPEPLK